MLMPASNVLGMDSLVQSAANSRVFPVVAEKLCFERGGNRIIDNLSFRLEDVPCTAIIGANGAGKSVLLRLLHGLLEPTSGTVAWGTSPQASVHQQQAMVFQKPVLLKRSVAANLSYVLKRRGLRGEALEQAIASLLALANLSAAANRSAHVLSGGEAQRLAIVRALATQPTMLLLDEPSASLDPSARAAIESLLSQTMANGVRVIIVTQDIGQAARLADEILVLHEGRVAEQGCAKQVLESPRSVEASRFLNHKI